ncbi:MAG: hypothetical protein Q4G35_11600 [Propionibacteriaceae bacterium]|nr:hypothetical protein [Propionibacteriaceae bacterium]
MKAVLAVLAMVVAVIVSACGIGEPGRGAKALEEWGATQTDFPGAQVKRESWKMGTTGATVHYTVDGVAGARRFAEGLRAELARIKPKSGTFTGRVTWPVEGGRVVFVFPVREGIAEDRWALADAPLPEAAGERRLGWMESKAIYPDRDDAIVPLEYVSTDLLATARAAEAPSSLHVAVRLEDGSAGWLGPFAAEEFGPRARNLEAQWDKVSKVRGNVVDTEREFVVEVGRRLQEHAWEISAPWLSINVGPGIVSEFDLAQWVADNGDGYSMRFQGGQIEITGRGEEVCGRFLQEAPPTGKRGINLTCRVDGADAFLFGTFDQLRTFLPPGVKAAKAGAKYVTLRPGEVGAKLLRERPETWEPVTAALREVGWEGEQRVVLQGYVASRLEFTSTATGKATDVQLPKNPSAEHQADIDQLIAAWNATAG